MTSIKMSFLVCEERENVVVNEGSNDQDFTVGASSDSLVTNEIIANVKTLER